MSSQNGRFEARPDRNSAPGTGEAPAANDVSLKGWLHTEPSAVIDYYREQLPSATDAVMMSLCRQFMEATGAERTAFQAALQAPQRALFGIFGHRAATLAVRESSSDKLLCGLVGSVIANSVVSGNRRVEVALAVFHHCARRLELEPSEVFARAARYAPPALARLLEAFGRRRDVSLQMYGWQEIKTPEGVKYKFSWG